MSLRFYRVTVATIAALSATLGPPAHGFAQAGSPISVRAEPKARFADARKAILQTLEEAKVPSIAVAVVKDGRIIWEEGFGWADKERRIPATANTPYSIASMTKPFTATAVMKLRDAGKLDIDAPIEKYLGGVKLASHGGRSDEVTARRIMAHSAGLPQYGNFYLDGAKPAGSEETISKFGMVVFPPNTRFEYSNIGMKILDAAIEQTSGLSYGEYLRREVFSPLGMTNSAVGLPPGVQAAVRYDPDRKPMRFYMTDHPGSGDVWASAHDLARFLAFHMGAPLSDQKPILSPATRLEMQRPASAMPMPTPPGAPRRDVGANWILTPVNGHLQVWHSGGQPGVSSFMAFYPGQKLAIVLLANSSAPLGRISQAIRQAIAPELSEPTAEPSPSSPHPIPFRGRWVGAATSYAGEQPMTLTFAETGEVTVQLADQASTPLSQPAFDNGALTGRFTGRSNIPEAQRTSHGLSLKVVRVGDQLVGQLVAQGMNQDTVFMLPSFVRLRPTAEGPPPPPEPIRGGRGMAGSRMSPPAHGGLRATLAFCGRRATAGSCQRLWEPTERLDPARRAATAARAAVTPVARSAAHSGSLQAHQHADSTGASRGRDHHPCPYRHGVQGPAVQRQYRGQGHRCLAGRGRIDPFARGDTGR
ncbi:MAG TPA: serine hydrolase domain-containing protein [Caulobacter sp.]|nr:serine hydrolase domain-containing protein [Caulobacter sp.]